MTKKTLTITRRLSVGLYDAENQIVTDTKEMLELSDDSQAIRWLIRLAAKTDAHKTFSARYNREKADDE